MKKLALITGATSGLGLSYAKYFAREGYDLIITGRRQEVIEKNADALKKQYNVDVLVVIIDLSSKEGVDFLLNSIKDREISVLVNNAGFGLKPTFADTDEADIERLLYLQTSCVTRLTHYVLKNMCKKNEGIIINISSDGAFAVMPHNVLYSSTKLFILNFTEGLHLELAKTNIQVQVVCPGFIDSHFHESAGMHMNKSKKGLFAFRSPDEIVADAMKDFKKGIIVSVPDRGAKLIRFVVKLMPRKMFYKKVVAIASSLSAKKNSIGGKSNGLRI